MVNRIGDFGFLLGIFLLFWSFAHAGVPTVEFREMAANVGLLATARSSCRAGSRSCPAIPSWRLLTLACLCLFVGACGKSAQIPLYVWLPDAMAGPTPVSALIHAATMVTAGVYMVCRMSFAYSLAPGAQATVAWTGALTAFFAATIGLAQTDIKKVLAYSTVSQLGYMFLAAGVGGVQRGGLPPDDARLLQGAAVPRRGLGDPRHAPRAGHHADGRPAHGACRGTWLTFLVGVLAIAGVPPFSGFFSKDEILLAAHEAHGDSGHTTRSGWSGSATAVLTAFYMFRLYFLVFTGESRAEPPHAASTSTSRGAGCSRRSWCSRSLVGDRRLRRPARRVRRAVRRAGVEQPAPLPAAGGARRRCTRSTTRPSSGSPSRTTLVGLAGIAPRDAALLRGARDLAPRRSRPAIRPLYALVRDKYRIDELYDALIVRPLERALAQRAGARRSTQGLIDGVGVNGAANVVPRDRRRRAQVRCRPVYAQSYLFVMLLGGALLVAWLVRGA